MRILVTGGAGYVGSHAACHLASLGHVPVVLDNLSTGHREFARFGPFEYGDVQDERRVGEVLHRYDIDAVLHFAALSLVSESISCPERYLQVNVGGMLALLAAMKAAGVARLVFSSSAAVYGEALAATIPETQAPGNQNPYGLSKLMAEQVLAAVAPTFGLRWASLRYFNVVGADADSGLREWHEPETHVLPNLLAAARSGKPFQLYGADYPTPDGTAVRDYVDVRDLAAVHWEALERLESGQSFISNVGHGVGTSVRTLLAAAERAWGLRIAVENHPRRPGDPASLVADHRFLMTWSATARKGFRPLADSLQSVADRHD